MRRRPHASEHRRHRNPSYGLIRAADISIALCALVALGPLMVLVAVTIAMLDPGPVIFRHRRLGEDGRSFGCLKFRSMLVDSAQRLEEHLRSDGNALLEWQVHRKLQNDPRVTPIGRFLRKSSIDELPQLFNVLFGDMSIVGPRPIVEDEIGYYGRYFAQYVSVKPGLTGLWQVSGRNNVSYRRRVAMDVIYARRRSLGFNMMILGLTVPAVVKAHGCS